MKLVFTRSAQSLLDSFQTVKRAVVKLLLGQSIRSDTSFDCSLFALLGSAFSVLVVITSCVVSQQAAEVMQRSSHQGLL